MSSKGHIVVLEAWYNSMARVVWLSGRNANTITRVGPFGNLATYFDPQVFGWMDVDDAVTSRAGSFTDPRIGACGPQDDIVLFKVDSNPGSAADNDRWSFDGTFNFLSKYDGNGFFGDGGPDFPSEGPGGTGHYPWGFCFSKTQFRMLSWGLDPLGFFDWRPVLFGDPDMSTDMVGFAENLTHPYPVVDTGWQLWVMGTRGIFPLGSVLLLPCLDMVVCISTERTPLQCWMTCRFCTRTTTGDQPAPCWRPISVAVCRAACRALRLQWTMTA